MAQSYGEEAKKEKPLDGLMSFKSLSTARFEGLQVASGRSTRASSCLSLV